MAPRERKVIGSSTSSASDDDDDNNNLQQRGKTQVFHTPDGAPYIICDSSDAFVNPTTPPHKTPEQINQELNLDLGQNWIKRDNTTLLSCLKVIDMIFVQWWEVYFFVFWNMVPLSIRRALTFGGWKIFLFLHRHTLGRRTGLHPSQSEEYHAFTTLAWWSRFFVISPRRIRFSLGQMPAVTPNVVESRLETISERVEIPNVPDKQKDHCTVKGLFVHHPEDDQHSDHLIFWVYGGAYLGGDVPGNASAADYFARQCKCDVFIPEFRLAPEYDADDVMWDVLLAYKWICSSRQRDPSKVFILGLSSGGAICVRLMQYIAEYQRNEDLLQPYMERVLNDDSVKMPKGAILFGPYLDYTVEKKGSFLHYARHDLIVTEAVQDYGLPYLEKFIPKGKRREYSPVYRSMEGLAPICMHISEHESVYDSCISLTNQARAQGVQVTLGVWKYMCHVFTFLNAFVPEGQVSMNIACDWIRKKSKEN